MSSRKRKINSTITSDTTHDNDSMISPLSRHTRSKDKNNGDTNSTKSSKRPSAKKTKIDEQNNNSSSSIQRTKKSKDAVDERINDNNQNVPRIDNVIDIHTNTILSDQQEMQKLWTNEAYHIISNSDIQSNTPSSIHDNNIGNKASLGNNQSPSNASIFTSTSTSLPSLFLSNISASRKKSPTSTLPSLTSSLTASMHSLPTPIMMNRATADPIRIMSSSQQIIADNTTSTPHIRKREPQTPGSRILNIFTPASINKIAAQIESSRKSPILFFLGIFIIFSLGALSNHMAKTAQQWIISAREINNLNLTEKQHRLQALDALEKEINLLSNDIKFEENQLIKIKQLISPIKSPVCSSPECILQRTIELERNISLFRPSLTSLSNSIRDVDTSTNEALFSITNDITELVNKVNLHDQYIIDKISNADSSLQENDLLLKNFDES